MVFFLKFVIHFQFIFVYSVRVCSSFIDLYVAVQLSQHYWLKRLFPILYSHHHCWRLINHKYLDLFLGSLFGSIVPMSVLVLVPHCFDCSSFVKLSEV